MKFILFDTSSVVCRPIGCLLYAWDPSPMGCLIMDDVILRMQWIRHKIMCVQNRVPQFFLFDLRNRQVCASFLPQRRARNQPRTPPTRNSRRFKTVQQRWHWQSAQRDWHWQQGPHPYYYHCGWKTRLYRLTRNQFTSTTYEQFKWLIFERWCWPRKGTFSGLWAVIPTHAKVVAMTVIWVANMVKINCSYHQFHQWPHIGVYQHAYHCTTDAVV